MNAYMDNRAIHLFDDLLLLLLLEEAALLDREEELYQEEGRECEELERLFLRHEVDELQLQLLLLVNACQSQECHRRFRGHV